MGILKKSISILSIEKNSKNINIKITILENIDINILGHIDIDKG